MVRVCLRIGFAGSKDVCKVQAHALLGGDGGDLEHPCGRVDALRHFGHVLYALKVLHKGAGVPASGPIVDCPAASLEKQQLIEGLQPVAESMRQQYF